MIARQKGFSFIELVVIVAFVGVLGFVITTAVNNHSKSASTSPSTSVSPVPQVTSKADLTKAEKDADALNIDDSSADADSLDKDAAAL